MSENVTYKCNQDKLPSVFGRLQVPIIAWIIIIAAFIVSPVLSMSSWGYIIFFMPIYSSYVVLFAKFGRFITEIVFDDESQECIVTYQYFIGNITSVSISYKELSSMYKVFVVFDDGLRIDVSEALRLYKDKKLIGEIRHDPSKGWLKEEIKLIHKNVERIKTPPRPSVTNKI